MRPGLVSGPCRSPKKPERPTGEQQPEPRPRGSDAPAARQADTQREQYAGRRSHNRRVSSKCGIGRNEEPQAKQRRGEGTTDSNQSSQCDGKRVDEGQDRKNGQELSSGPAFAFRHRKIESSERRNQAVVCPACGESHDQGHDCENTYSKANRDVESAFVDCRDVAKQGTSAHRVSSSFRWLSRPST